jgi:hypothetical protein
VFSIDNYAEQIKSLITGVPVNEAILKLRDINIVKISGSTVIKGRGLTMGQDNNYVDNNVSSSSISDINAYSLFDLMRAKVHVKNSDISVFSFNHIDYQRINNRPISTTVPFCGGTVDRARITENTILIGTDNLMYTLSEIAKINEGENETRRVFGQRQWGSDVDPVLSEVTVYGPYPRILGIIATSPIPSSSSNGGKPKSLLGGDPIMPDNCCNETNELLEDIYEMLGGDDFKEEGLEIPNHLFIPGGKGDTKGGTYNALFNLLFRVLDHRTCGEVEISIKDNNIMKKGDQGYTFKAINNTAAIGKLMEISQKQDADLSALLNLLIRLSWISVQILKLTNIGSEGIKVIISFFGIPVKEKIQNIDIPVDPSLGGTVGFDPKKPTEDQLIKILDLDNPEKTVKILDKFMNNSKIPVKVKSFIGDKRGGSFWWLMDKSKGGKK